MLRVPGAALLSRSCALLLGAACLSSTYLTLCPLLGLSTLLEVTALHVGILALRTPSFQGRPGLHFSLELAKLSVLNVGLAHVCIECSSSGERPAHADSMSV